MAQNFKIHYNKNRVGWDSAYWKQYNLIEEVEVVPPVEAPSNIETSNVEVPEKDNDNHNNNNVNETYLPEYDEKEVLSADLNHRRELVTSSIPIRKKVNTKKVEMVSIKRCKGKRHSIIIVIRKNRKVSGYQIFYRRKGKRKYKSIFLKSWKKNQKTLKKMKSSCIYYVKVRAYKIVEGKKYYSKFSQAQKIKTK